MKVFNQDVRVPIKSWCENPEQGALDQAKNLANLPFVFKQVCLMPDTHQGYGMPIGGVTALKNVVCPNMVGVDIGCGMLAVQTSLRELDTDTLKKIMGTIRETVPVGFNHRSEKVITPDELFGSEFAYKGLPVCEKEAHNACFSLGTLGGGNHFIEIQKGSDGYVWYMIHSGSRNLGKKVADYHNNIAKELNRRWFSEVKEDADLAFLPLDTEEARLYMCETNLCLLFAQQNRYYMSQLIKQSFISHCPKDKDVAFDQEINVHHNYANLENHFGKNVVVHRKGATSAKEGQLGIIPGSQGTSSYIVRGKGNLESFTSCSHGAGRKMGRREASRSLNLAEEQKKLNDRGIIHSVRNSRDLDEAPGSYKDIDVVMNEQKDLVDIVVKLEPLGVIKG